MGKQEWLYYVRPQNIPVDYIPWESSEAMPFIKTIKWVMSLDKV